MNANSLPGPLKAAVLLKTVRGDTLDQVLSMLTSKEKELIVSNLSQLGEVSSDVVEKVAEEFTHLLQERKKGSGTPPAIKDTKADKANSERKSGKLEAIQSIEPDKLVGYIKTEHPQTIAVILAHLKPPVASVILSLLPEETSREVVVRIADLDKVMTGMVDELDTVFEDILSNIEDSGVHKVGGVDQLAEILNQSGESALEQIMAAIEDENPELAAEIKQRMFIFDDLVLVDDRGLQQVFRKVETKELALALKAASDDVKDKIFKNMSSRAGQILMEEIDSLGAIKMQDVESAQQKITGIIQEMESKGEIVISGRGGGDYIV